jgi:hypothetical protein
MTIRGWAEFAAPAAKSFAVLPLSRRIVQPCGLAEHIELCSPSAVAQTSQHTLLIGLGEPRKTKLTAGM